jgi:hypothetical protein
VDRDTLVSRTPTVAPGSLARGRALLRERRARGPQKLLGPPTARVNTRSEDHVKMQRLQTRGVIAAGETKRRAMQQSPRRQTVMMARRFTAERCTNASIPALRFDASTPAVPLKYSLLETSAPHPLPPVPLLPQRPQSKCIPPPPPPPLDRARGRCAAGAPGQQEQGEDSRPVDDRRRRPPAHRRAEAGRGESRCPRDLQRSDPSGSSAWGRSGCAIADGGSAGSPLPREH